MKSNKLNFSQIITNWYSINKRNLPWRETNDPYRIWLSEIMLQQTQVKQGLPYFLKFVAHFPTVFDLATASEHEVLNQWQGLGYYSRARNLHTTAKYIAEENNGLFPNTYQDLLKLKGIGDYTASAIASICFGEPTAVVDGNVYRVLSRYFGIDVPINSTKGQKLFKALAMEVLDKKDPAEHNQAIMEFGAIQCKPKNPDCNSCPLNASCVALCEHSVDTLPVKLKKGKVKKRYFNYLIIQPKEGQVALKKRIGRGIWKNMYEFPLIETETTITEAELIALPRFKELVKSEKPSCYLFNQHEIVHKLSHQHLYTKFWILENTIMNIESVAINDLKDYPTPVLISNFVNEYNFDE